MGLGTWLKRLLVQPSRLHARQHPIFPRRGWLAPIAICLALGLPSVGLARVQEPSVPDFSSVKRAAQFGFYQLREEQPSKFELSKALAYREIAERHGKKTFDDVHDCLDPVELEVYTSFAAAGSASNLGEWRNSRSDARNMLRIFRSNFKSMSQRGALITPEYGGALHWRSLARKTTNDLERDLYWRVFKDQFFRSSLSFMSGNSWAKRFSPSARIRFNQLIQPEMCEQGRRNTAWLNMTVRTHGWFSGSRYGADAATAAWLLLQHSDNAPEIQAKLAETIRPLVGSGGVSETQFAYLQDRIAVNYGRMQTYATQGRCISPGVWRVYPTEQETDVDERRAKIWLPPVNVYEAAQSRFC